MKRVGIDLDGVLVDFSGYVYKYLSQYVENLPPIDHLFNRLYWEHSISVPEDAKDLMNQIFDPKNTYHWERMPSLVSKKDLIAINECEDGIVFITSRPHYTFDASLNWLKKNIGPTIKYSLVTGAMSKAAVCDGLYIAKYLDDRYIYAAEIATRSRCRSYLLNSSENKEFDNVEHIGIKRVNTIAEFINDN